MNAVCYVSNLFKLALSLKLLQRRQNTPCAFGNVNYQRFDMEQGGRWKATRRS